MAEQEHIRVLNMAWQRTETAAAKQAGVFIRIDRQTKWGNPFSHKRRTTARYEVSSREEAIAQYREMLLDDSQLLAALPELKGKVLGCWCAPLACHGDVLIEVMREMGIEDA